QRHCTRAARRTARVKPRALVAHFALRTTDSALRTPHPALRTPHCALRTAHSALRTPHCAPRTAHSALRTPHCALRTADSALTSTYPHSLSPARSALQRTYSIRGNADTARAAPWSGSDTSHTRADRGRTRRRAPPRCSAARA